MNILWILLSCLAGGAVFAYLAVWLSTKKGNTISDVLNSTALGNAEAIKIEILDKVKVTSNLPIVALYIVAFAVAIVLPAFISWQLLKDTPTITLSGAMANFSPDKKLYVMPKAMRVESSGSFDLPLAYIASAQIINIEGEHYNPVTLTVTLSKLRNVVLVEISNSSQPAATIPFDWETMRASLAKPIPLVPAAAAIPAPTANRASSANPVRPEFQNVGEPPRGQK